MHYTKKVMLLWCTHLAHGIHSVRYSTLFPFFTHPWEYTQISRALYASQDWVRREHVLCEQARIIPWTKAPMHMQCCTHLQIQGINKMHSACSWSYSTMSMTLGVPDVSNVIGVLHICGECVHVIPNVNWHLPSPWCHLYPWCAQQRVNMVCKRSGGKDVRMLFTTAALLSLPVLKYHTNTVIIGMITKLRTP